MSHIDNTELITNIAQKLNRPLVLVGLMGAGKTRIGRELAKILSISFYDSDTEIEAAAGCAVSDIFDWYGEQAFRDTEHRVIKRLLDEKRGAVIATGGGALTNAQTLQNILNESYAIWLKAPLSVLVERTGRTNRRPILQTGNPEKILQSLEEKRRPLYEQSHVIAEIKDDSPRKTALKVLQALDNYLK